MKSKFILGSSSPRRKRLFKELGVEFEIVVPNIDESKYSYIKKPDKFVKVISTEKMKKIENKIDCNDTIIVTADTIVYFDEIITKPESHKQAFKMLKKLSGKTHFVYTGVSLKKHDIQREFVEKTRVKFMRLNDKEIENYLENAVYHDKAGGYAIQGFGGFLIEKIEGDYYNIVGFPINRFIKIMKSDFGVNII